MNNCFIDSIISALLNYEKFNIMINKYLNNLEDKNDLLYFINNKDSQKISNLILPNRRNTQEDVNEFLTNNLLPHMKIYTINEKKIILNNYDLVFINQFINYNKSNLEKFLREFFIKYYDSFDIDENDVDIDYNNKYLNINNKYYNFINIFYDFKNINDVIKLKENNYYKINITLDNLFHVCYIDKNKFVQNRNKDNIITSNFIINKNYNITLYNNINLEEQLKNIYFISYNKFIIINILYINIINNNNNYNIIKYVKNNDKEYNLKSIIYYYSKNINDMTSNFGHYYTIKVNNKQNYNLIYNNSKAVLLFYEIN